LHFGDDGFVGCAEVIEHRRSVSLEFVLDFRHGFGPCIGSIVDGSGDGAAMRQSCNEERVFGGGHSGSGD
jgi:hypothetical protein